MSNEDAKKVIAKAHHDGEFLTKLEGLVGEGVDSTISFLHDSGFEVTADELKQVMADLHEGELTLDELATIAGGAGGVQIDSQEEAAKAAADVAKNIGDKLNPTSW